MLPTKSDAGSLSDDENCLPIDVVRLHYEGDRVVDVKYPNRAGYSDPERYRRAAA